MPRIYSLHGVVPSLGRFGVRHGWGRTCPLVTAVFVLAIGGAVRPAAASCQGLARLSLPDTIITSADPVTSGTFIAPDGSVFNNLPPFCRVAATLNPTADSDIKVEVWMPFSGWNGRYLTGFAWLRPRDQHQATAEKGARRVIPTPEIERRQPVQ